MIVNAQLNRGVYGNKWKLKKITSSALQKCFATHHQLIATWRIVNIAQQKINHVKFKKTL